MTTPILAVLALAAIVAGYFLLPIARRKIEEARKKKLAEFYADQEKKNISRLAELEAELANFPQRYNEIREKCNPFQSDRLVARHISRASEEFAAARNCVRLKDSYGASKELSQARTSLRLALDQAGTLRSRDESQALLTRARAR